MLLLLLTLLPLSCMDVQYFYLWLDSGVRTFQVMPDFLSLVLLCLTRQYWDIEALNQATYSRCAAQPYWHSGVLAVCG